MCRNVRDGVIIYPSKTEFIIEMQSSFFQSKKIVIYIFWGGVKTQIKNACELV
jgi:hypothetical protein